MSGSDAALMCVTDADRILDLAKADPNSKLSAVVDPLKEFFGRAYPSTEVHVNTMTGKRATISPVFPHLCSVSDIKLALQEKWGIPPDQQRLLIPSQQVRTLAGGVIDSSVSCVRSHCEYCCFYCASWRMEKDCVNTIFLEKGIL